VSAFTGTAGPTVAEPPTAMLSARRGAAKTNPTSEALLTDPGYVRLVRWVFTARLVCLALATPAALTVATSKPVATLSLFLLTISSLVFSRSDRLIATLIRHPLLASLDTAVSIALLTTVSAGQPAALTVVCTALVAGLLFPRRVLVLLVVPLVVGSLGAPAAVLSAAPMSWQSWLALIAGMPALVLGVCVIGSVVQRNVQSMVEARQQAAEAVAAVGAAQERARLARDMHDSVGKSIHGISLGSKALRRMVDRDPAMAKELAGSLADAADQAAREARALLMSLREGQVERPTVEVVSEVLADWQATTGITAQLVDVAAVDASPAVTAQMVAALREILHNIAKHAEAGAVTVRLTGDPEQIELTVTDDGVGFDLDRAQLREAAGHFGLRGLRERAEQVGGTVEITSEKRKGTTVRWTAQRHWTG
jgi:signal transduction histidine kinase